MANVDQVWLALTFADGTTGLHGFVTTERRSDGSVRWLREASDEEIEKVILQLSTSTPTKENPEWNGALPMAKVPVMGWRRLSEEERAVFEQREYRNALIDTGSSIEHDMVKARELHREKLRQARSAQLLTLDVDYLRADETSDAAAKAEIVTAKQALRDVTQDPAIEAADSIEALKAIWPLGLGD